MSIKYVDLNWDDFAKFYNLLYSIITLLEHVITKFPNLFHFMVGPYRIPPSWKLGPIREKQL